MGIVYVVLGVFAVIVLRIAFPTSKNPKTINDGEEVIRVTLTGLREKGHAGLADVEESKLTDASVANDAYLTVVGKGYSGHHGNKENFVSASAVAFPRAPITKVKVENPSNVDHMTYPKLRMETARVLSLAPTR